MANGTNGPRRHGLSAHALKAMRQTKQMCAAASSPVVSTRQAISPRLATSNFSIAGRAEIAGNALPLSHRQASGI